MSAYKNTNNGSRGTAVIDFLTPKVVLSVILLIGSIIFYLRWKKSKDAEINANNPTNEDNIADSIKPKSSSSAVWERLKEDTRKIVHHLGVNYPWYDSRSWSENDKEVAMLLMQQRPNIRHIELLYFNVYAKGKNLKNDVYRLLDKTQLNQVVTYYKLKGSTF